MKKLYAVITILIIILSLSACEIKQVSVTDTKKDVQNVDKPKENVVEQITIESKNNIDLSVVKPNENGQIMIVMYHGIGQKEEEWVRTPDNFKKDLQALYDRGYRLISLRDYIENNIKVEPGCTPFVMTFDDSLLNQFNIIEENGQKKIDPDCAVGILEEFFKKHSDFGRGGSFYVYYPIPFRQKELIQEKFEFLVQNGYEIGCHGYNHENLGKLSKDEVVKVLAKSVEATRKYIPDYEVFSIALPYGIAPKGDDFSYAVSGEYNGYKYNHRAILKVGSNPAPAPNHIKFDALRLPRVRASEMKVAGTGLYDYLAYFEKHPHKKYISDGNPDTIAIPKAEEDNLNLEGIKDKKVIIYDRED